jgi:hypothetical protein
MVNYVRVPLGHVLHRIRGNKGILVMRLSAKKAKSRQVKIDRDQFRDGFDILVKTDYQKKAYEKVEKAPNAKDPLVKSDLKHAKKSKRIFNEWLDNKQGDTAKNGRQKPYVYDTLTKVSCCEHKFGECLLGCANKTKAGFKCRFTSKKGSDGYVHHVSILANSQTDEPIHKLSLLKKVSQKKQQENAYSISHICGNGGCARPGHLIIEKKYLNDERASCHRFLRRCRHKLECRMIRRLCNHTPKCFINIYSKIKSYY